MSLTAALVEALLGEDAHRGIEDQAPLLRGQLLVARGHQASGQR
jgi:hypothetical protein